MEQTTGQPPQAPAEAPGSAGAPSGDKRPWQAPKLTFVEPTLTPHGALTRVTGQGFFGGFTP
jgi:hypothetical protein